MWPAPAALLVTLVWAATAGLCQGRLTSPASGSGITYTRNAACFPRYCINPLVPGLEMFGRNVLSINANRTWSCAESRNAFKLAGICQRVVAGYHFSLPDPEDGVAVGEEDRIREQSRKALNAYVSHLSGMGQDFWDQTEPWNADSCVQAVWKMACYTHFPRCDRFGEGRYLRPCANSCEGYLKACGVKCCDEGAQCVFTHRRVLADGTILDEEGYDPHDGPSPRCTGSIGAAAPAARPQSFLLLTVAIAALAFPAAAVGAWLE